MATQAKPRTSTKPKAARAPRRTVRKKTMTPEERYMKVQEEAYLRAERDGFKANPVDYWLAAEAAVQG